MITIIFILLLALIVGYLIFHVKKLKLVRENKKLKYISLVLTIVYLIMCFWIGKTATKTIALIIMFIFYCYFITDVFNFIFKLILKNNIKKVWSYLYNSSIAAITLGIILIPIGYYTATNVVVTNYEIHSNKSFSQDKLNISMISDLHFGTTMDLNSLKEQCEKIENLNPDIVVLVGDIFDESTTKEEMEEASKLLGKIKSKYGTYYVFGNHDTSIYRKSPNFNKEEIYENLENSNIVVLEDDAALINNELLIFGRIDKSMVKGERVELSEFEAIKNKDNFILLLDHQPLDYEMAEQNGVDLELSGHTHNGQIWPFGVFIDLFKTADLRYGQKTIKDFNAIVSSGIGGWGYPLKLGAKSEIVNIQVNFKN